jgi:hypothetical protein
LGASREKPSLQRNKTLASSFNATVKLFLGWAHMPQLRTTNLAAFGKSVERNFSETQARELSRRLRDVAQEMRCLRETHPDYSSRMQRLSVELDDIARELRRTNPKSRVAIG